MEVTVAFKCSTQELEELSRALVLKDKDATVRHLEARIASLREEEHQLSRRKRERQKKK